jgi:hypothetical protein
MDPQQQQEAANWLEEFAWGIRAGHYTLTACQQVDQEAVTVVDGQPQRSIVGKVLVLTWGVRDA